MRIKVGHHQHLMKALISLVCLAGTSLPALAQSPQALEEVLITGSSIKRVQAEGPLPVQTFTQQDIERTGVTSVTDFIQKLPVMQGFRSQAESVGGGGNGVTTASLHDIGEQYTLVLLNGRRVAPTDSGTTINLNSIPLSAIERVEVLTDGASAVYGADAIAGVVNFILKQGYQPLTVDARVSVLEYGGGQQQNFAISQGWGGLQSQGYELFLSASFDKTNRLKSSDREFAKTGNIGGSYGNLSYTFDPDNYRGFFNGSSRSIPANVTVYYNDPIDGPSAYAFSPYFENNGSCPQAHMPFNNQCYFDYTTTVEIAPEVKRAAIYGSGELKLGDSGWNLFGDLAYADVSTIARIAPMPGEFPMDKTNQFYTDFVEPYLTLDQQNNINQIEYFGNTRDKIIVKYRLYELGNRVNEYNSESLHLVTGLNGNLAGWDATGTVTVSNQTMSENYVSGYPLETKFVAGLDSNLFNPFLYTLGTMPASEAQALKGTQFSGNFSTDKISMLGFDGNIQRAILQISGGDLVASLGLNYSTLGYKTTLSPEAEQGKILFDDPSTPFNLSRNNLGLYAESLAPITKELDVTAAVRFDQVSAVKNKITGATGGKSQSNTTYKLGTKWQASDSLAFRASYGTGFRVADMKQLAQPIVNAGVTGGVYSCPFSSSNPPITDPKNFIANGYQCEYGQFEVVATSNPNLKPETSKQWNAGLVWQPLESTAVGVNYWSVKISNAVSSVGESLIFDHPDTYIDLFTTKTKPNGVTYVAIIDKPINLGGAENRGIDWDFSYKTNVRWGVLKLGVAGTHLLDSSYTVPVSDTESVWTTSLNKYGDNQAVSFENVVTASATLESGNWEHTLLMNSRDGYKDVQMSVDDCVFYDPNVDPDVDPDGGCRAGSLDVHSYTTYDWRTNWAVSKTFSMTLGVKNLFNEEPPLSLQSAASHALGYDPRYASPDMREFSLAFRKKY